jgi:hypothetical protein
MAKVISGSDFPYSNRRRMSVQYSLQIPAGSISFFSGNDIIRFI